MTSPMMMLAPTIDAQVNAPLGPMSAPSSMPAGRLGHPAGYTFSASFSVLI